PPPARPCEKWRAPTPNAEPPRAPCRCCAGPARETGRSPPLRAPPPPRRSSVPPPRWIGDRRIDDEQHPLVHPPDGEYPRGIAGRLDGSRGDAHHVERLVDDEAGLAPAFVLHQDDHRPHPVFPLRQAQTTAAVDDRDDAPSDVDDAEDPGRRIRERHDRRKPEDLS